MNRGCSSLEHIDEANPENAQTLNCVRLSPVMPPQTLAEPLDDAWREVLDTVLETLGAGTPTTRHPERLGERVAELSRAYNTGSYANLPLEARVGFSFARDVPKGAAAVRELVATETLRVPPDRPLRVMDVGAGLGAMTWGIARALRGQTGAIDAVLFDEDEAALHAGERIFREAERRGIVGPLGLSLSTRKAKILTSAGTFRSALGSLPRADVVIAGQVLSELDTTLAPEERVRRHAAFLVDLLDGFVAEHGSLVIVEPALRDRTRHLHAVRDALLARATVFSPCLHQNGCPMLPVDTDWCHEDLEIDLPPWLVPVARAAGLRFQGLTFSYLVLRRDGVTLNGLLRLGADPARPNVRFRAVSGLLETKGKAELWGCKTSGERVLWRRLDRDERDAPGFGDLRRGDVVSLESDPPLRDGRISREVRIDVWPPRK